MPSFWGKVLNQRLCYYLEYSIVMDIGSVERILSIPVSSLYFGFIVFEIFAIWNTLILY